jgi:hypothetical protein
MTRFFLPDVLRGWVGVGKCSDLNEAGAVDWSGVGASMVLAPSAQFCNALPRKGFAFTMELCKGLFLW